MPAETGGGGSRPRQEPREGGGGGKLLSPARRREAVCHVKDTLSVSERRACRVVGQCRATPQYVPSQADDEEPLWARIVVLAREYGRYGLWADHGAASSRRLA